MKNMKLKYYQIFILFFLCNLITFSFPTNAHTDGKTTVIKKIIEPIKKIRIPKKKTSTKNIAFKTIGGSSAVLRTRLGTKTGYEAHHIIPVELKNHRVLNKIGMDMDNVKNGISLPQYPGLDPKLPLHRGSHPNYTQAVKSELDKIPDDLSISQTRKQISSIQNFFRTKLENGSPLHTSQGGSW
jgi:hypothetical protein